MKKIISFDGCGLNDARDKYRKRLFTGYRPHCEELQGIGKQIETAVNSHEELIKIAKAYRNLLRTMAHTEGEVQTFHHIEEVLAKTEGKGE